MMLLPFSFLRVTAFLGGIALLAPTGALRAEVMLPEGCSDVFRGQRITIIVPNAAGGGYDLYARALAPVLSEISGASAMVSNMPGGGGKAALVRVASAPPSEMVLLFEAANDLISTIGTDPSLNVAVEDLEAMGIVHSEPETWLGRIDLDLTDPAVTQLVSASAIVEGNIIPMILAARAIGIEARIVAGYASSSESVAAILRGEADVSSTSLTTALRAAESNDLRVLMVLDDVADPRYPDIPLFGGADGLVAQRNEGLPEEERARRADLARIVVAFTNNARVLFAPERMESDKKLCLSAAVDAAITSEAFAEGAKAVKRPVTPQVGSEAKAVFAELEAAYIEVLPLLEATLLELQGE